MPSLEDLTTDQLLARARETESAHSLLHALTSNPETREQIQRAIKKINPKVSIPEIDSRDAVRDEIKVEREERIKLENSIRERDIRDRIEKQRASVMAKYKLSDADMLEVEKLMVSETDPIPSYDAAARVFQASKTSATPTPASFAPPTFDMPDQDTWGAGIGNQSTLNKIGLSEAFRAFSDIKQGKVAGLS